MKPLTVRGIICLVMLFGLFQSSHAQNSNVSIGTETIKDRAILWLKAEGNQGLILPVISNRSTFSGLNNSDDKGMIVYDNSDNKIYYWNGTAWIEAGGGSGGANQTLTLSGNTFSLSGSPASTVPLSSTTPATGQLLVWDGTKWVAANIGGDVTGAAGAAVVSGLKGQPLPTTLPSTANALVYNGIAWAFQPLSSTGEANTASNVGTAGVGVFKQKTGVNLEFQKINASSNRITVSQDVVNSEIDIDVNQANLSIASTQITGLGALAALSAITSAQLTNGTIIDEDISTAANINIAKLAPGTNGQVLTTTGGIPTWSNPSAGGGTVTSVATGAGLTGGPIVTTGTISIAPNGVTNAHLADNAVTLTKVAANSVDASKIVDASITAADMQNATITADKLNASGANANDVLRYNGTAWVPAAVSAGGSVTSVATGAGLTGGPITATGTISIAPLGVTNALLADNAVTNAKIAALAVELGKMAANSVDASKIVDASITGADIQNATITIDKLNASGAVANDVLRYNGTAWTTGALSAWSLTGNAGTNPATNFIGTTDNNAFEVRVNNTRVMRYELNPTPTTGGTASPNIIAGYSGNSAAPGIKGSVVSGGGLENANTVDGDWAVIGGGRDNHAGLMTPYSAYSTVGGGASNVSTGQWSTIAGGKNNTATGNASAIPGGARLIASSFALTVVGSANVDPGNYTETSWVATEPIFIVGNGQIDGSANVIGRSNAFTILKNGWAGIGRTPTANRLEVEGEASKTTASGWAANSDRRIKTDIVDIDNSIDLIKRLRPVKFKYTPEWVQRHPSIKNQFYFNFIAQEYAQVFPESVQSSGETLDDQAEPVLQIDTYNAQITAIKALQELIKKVEKLEAENTALKNEKASLESKVTSFEAQQTVILKEIAEIKSMLGAEAVNEIRK